MSKESLKRHLDALRRELAQERALDGDTRAMLAAVADDIDEALGEGDRDYDSLRERLQAATLRFEAEHPRFAGILADITDTLAKIGI